MKPNPLFARLPKSFWAAVRIVSQHCGYTDRKEAAIKVPSREEIIGCFQALGFSLQSLETPVNGQPLLELLHRYFAYRAHLLNIEVAPSLLDAIEARQLFEQLKKQFQPKCPLPMNKQKGKKRAPAFLTGIVNMIVEANVSGHLVDYDPRELTSVTCGGAPLRTLSRRVDGAFPSPINPVAIWEIKEYYHTTTFGSRVADGVYETLLDGMELEELAVAENRQVLHYLFLDARYTWWNCGKSYLCRIVDMVQMGYVDEVLVGSQVASKLPAIVQSWVAKLE